MTDRDALIAHLGRDVLHVSRDRNFTKAYRRTKDDTTVPLMWRTDSEELGKFQYAMLTNKQYAAVLVVDIDQPGTQGGHPINLAEELRVKLVQLVSRGLGPAWVGINRLSGKAQCLWLIDPVYADKDGKSSNMALLAATSRTLGGFLDHDPNFAHRFSRSPFYTGDSPDRYIWYRQHHRIDRLSDFIREVREVTDEPQHVSPRQEFSSGRELIETVKARREQAQAFRAIADEIEAEMGEETDRYNPDLIDGVLVCWINPGRAARDETAFRHVLKTAHRLRAAGERMTPMRRSSTPTSAPTTSPSVKVRTAGQRRCLRCGIARPWRGVCVVTSPRARPTPTAHPPPATPPQANARHWPPWAAGAARRPPSGGKQTPKANTPRTS